MKLNEIPKELLLPSAPLPPMDDRWRFDTTRILDQFRHFLKGEIEKRDGTWQKVGKQIMNNTGIEECMTYLTSIINPNTLMSYLDKHEIYEMTRWAALKFNALVYEKGEIFDIHPYSVPILINSISDFIFTTLKRAQDGGERKSLTQTLEEKIIRTQKEKEGGWKVPSLNPFRRGEE